MCRSHDRDGPGTHTLRRETCPGPLDQVRCVGSLTTCVTRDPGSLVESVFRRGVRVDEGRRVRKDAGDGGGGGRRGGRRRRKRIRG